MLPGIVNLLINNEAVSTEFTTDGVTPLSWRHINGELGILKALLEYGADINKAMTDTSLSRTVLGLVIRTPVVTWFGWCLLGALEGSHRADAAEAGAPQAVCRERPLLQPPNRWAVGRR